MDLWMDEVMYADDEHQLGHICNRKSEFKQFI